MKKGFIFFFILCLITSSVFSQDNEETLQTIHWETVENANKYQVEIEKLNTEEQWQPFYNEITLDSEVEVNFTPGRYRISVKPINVLGKAVDQGQWLRFRILSQEEWELRNKENFEEKNEPVFEEEEPEEEPEKESEEEPEKEPEEKPKVKEKKNRSRIWFTATRVGFDIPVNKSEVFSINNKVSADIIGTKWFFWNTGVYISPAFSGGLTDFHFGIKGGVETSLNYRYPFKYVSPYGGIAAGYTLFNESGLCTEKQEIYGAVVLGLEIMTYGEVKMYLGVDDILNKKEFFVSIGIGGIRPHK